MENSQFLPSQIHDPYDILHMLQTANLADSTRQKYIRVVESYLTTGGSLTDSAALTTFAVTLSPSRRGHLKSAVRKWTEMMATAVKGQATPDNIQVTQAILFRFEALQEAIPGLGAKGTKTHTWFSQKEVQQLAAPARHAHCLGRRDKIALGLCVAAGLRREEAVAVKFADMEQLPSGESTRTVIQVRGKGAKDRAVPIRAIVGGGYDGLGRRRLGRMVTCCVHWGVGMRWGNRSWRCSPDGGAGHSARRSRKSACPGRRPCLPPRGPGTPEAGSGLRKA